MLSSEDAVVVTQTGQGAFQVRVATGDHSFLMDEPSSVGGLSSGPSPFDMLCAALGSCTLMTMMLYASRKGWELTGLAVRVAHRKGSPEARDQFERTIELGDANEEQRERLLYIAGRCPVHLLLERGADVATSEAVAQLGDPKAEGLHEKLIDELCRDAA
jgi:putative redox protein